MLAEDWLNLTRTEGRSMEDNHPSLRLDMIAPLVQHKGMKEHTLGVLCVGRPSVRPRDEKLMLQVVTNLGALALMNTRNVGKLAEQAHHDGLTALLNKNQFMFELGKLIYHAERAAQKVSVFIFDIDHFKAYNDANGHPAGDELLKSLARLIKDNLRPGDMASRYGGEEFVVAMPETDGATAMQIAERIRQAIATHRFPHGESQPGGRLTISGGVASFPVDGSNGTELIGHADQALYRAKASGRNRVKRHRGVEIGDTGGRDEIDPYTVAEPDRAMERRAR
jgi:diguanylate cyclase (GGDEF)-like protein